MNEVDPSTRFGRFVAAIVTLAMVAFLTAILVGFHPIASWNEASLDLGTRLFPSLELLATALAIAVPIGFALAALKARGGGSLLAPAIDGSITVLRCIPFFVLVSALSVVAGLRLGYFENANPWSGNLIVPAVVLALFALPGVAQFDFFAKRPPWRTIALGCRCIAERLPQLIAAQFLVEIFFAWPGEGHAFITAIQMGRLGLIAPIVFCSAIAVVLLRLLVSILTTDSGEPAVV